MSTPDSNTDTTAQAQLAQGQQALAAGDLAAANTALRAARDVQATRLVAHNLIEQHQLPEAFGHWMGLNCSIAPQDDIFHFFDGHPSSINPIRDYLADGWRTLSELMLLLERVDQPLARCQSVLEFASGHGRFTRHLVKALGAELKDLDEFPTFDEAPEFYVDYGEQGPFVAAVGESECAV